MGCTLLKNDFLGQFQSLIQTGRHFPEKEAVSTLKCLRFYQRAWGSWLKYLGQDDSHCKLQFPTSTFCSGYLSSLQSNFPEVSTVMLPETPLEVFQWVVASMQLYCGSAGRSDLIMINSSEITDRCFADKSVPLGFGRAVLFVRIS